MNKLIKTQLDKVKEAVIPPYNNDTTQLIIHKRVENIDEDILQYKCYQIKIANYIINEPANFTLSANWNGGSKPTDEFMNIEVTNIMGKMIKVTGVGVNDSKMWDGWLPRKSFKIIQKL